PDRRRGRFVPGSHGGPDQDRDARRRSSHCSLRRTEGSWQVCVRHRPVSRRVRRPARGHAQRPCRASADSGPVNPTDLPWLTGSPRWNPTRSVATSTVMVNRMETIDGRCSALRHFSEQPGGADADQVLGIEEAGAKRYLHALKGFTDVLATMPGGWK